MRPGHAMLAALVLAGLGCSWAQAGAEVGAACFQWVVPVEAVSGTTINAHVWIPPEADRIRGIIIGSELSIAADSSVRSAAAAKQLAIIRLKRHFDVIFNYKQGSGPKDLQRVLDGVAEATGYREIAIAPWFPYGHSTACNFASNVGYWTPDRTFGLLVFKGGLTDPRFDPSADLSHVPVLAIKGQFEEFGSGPSGVLRDWEDRETGWKTSREQYLAMRERNERLLICLAVDAGRTHMAWSPRCGELTGVFIRKAADLRIPDWPIDATDPVKCLPVDVTNGVLTSSAVDQPDRMRTAPYADFKPQHGGGKRWSWWHADMEMAKAWERFHEGLFAKRTQFVTFANPVSGKLYYARHDLRFDIQPHWVGPDVFAVGGAFLMQVRDRYAAPEPPLGHADGPILFRHYTDHHLVQVGSNTFQIVDYGSRGTFGAIMAYHPGDAQYRYAEQPAGVRCSRLTNGDAQTITFPELPELTVNGPPVPLGASADSGLPVRYVVNHGPVLVEDGKLVMRSVPPRATLPISVSVTAYQWGSAVEPYVQTAASVTREGVVKP